MNKELSKLKRENLDLKMEVANTTRDNHYLRLKLVDRSIVNKRLKKIISRGAWAIAVFLILLVIGFLSGAIAFQ